MDLPNRTLSSAERKDQLARLKEFANHEDYKALNAELNQQIEEALDLITTRVPQTVGDFFDREQAIGALTALRNVRRFIPYRVEAAQELVDEVTTTDN